ERQWLIDLSWITPPGELPADRWGAWLNLQSGHIFQENGRLRPLSAREMAAATAAIVPAKSDGEKLSWQDTLLNWWLVPPDMRTLSPWSAELLAHNAGEYSMASGFRQIDCASLVESAPWHPLEPVALARSLLGAERGRAAYLASLTLTRLRAADI